MHNKKKIAIITGVSSFLGRSVAKKLINNGYIVFGIIRENSKRNRGLKEIKGLNLICLDYDKITLRDIEYVPYTKAIDNINAIRNNENDITFIHFAWGATLDRKDLKLQKQNVDMSIKVLEFARVLNVNRFIFAGSQAEYGKTAYGSCKKEFADYALSKNYFNFIHLRIFSIYGKEDRKTSLLKTLIHNIEKNKNMKLSTCDYLWNFLYIDDFVDIICKLIKRDCRSCTLDIASDDTRLLKDYVEEAHRVRNGKNILYFGEISGKGEKFAIPNISELKEKIGNFKFTRFAEGIKNI